MSRASCRRDAAFLGGFTQAGRRVSGGASRRRGTACLGDFTEAGRHVSGGLHGGVGSAPAAPLVRPVLGSRGDKVTPAGRASCWEGCRHGPESSGGFLSPWGLVTEITNDVGCAFISVVWRLCLRVRSTVCVRRHRLYPCREAQAACREEGPGPSLCRSGRRRPPYAPSAQCGIARSW